MISNLLWKQVSLIINYINVEKILTTHVIIAVERQAEQINMLKEGMWIEAKHVKRKDLHTYVSSSLLKKERKVRKNIFLYIL